jgi:hypothetical protein
VSAPPAWRIRWLSPPRYGGRRRPVNAATWVAPIIPIAVLVYAFGILEALRGGDSDVVHALLIAPVLVAVTLPLLRRLARRETVPGMGTILVAALLTKLIGALLRFYVAYHVYSGVADANDYLSYGRALAPHYRHLDFTAVSVGKLVGTGWIRTVTGSVFAVTGYTRLGGFLVFSWMGFLGTLLLWRAFRLAVPEGNSLRYALLLFFLPTLVYWPSSVGKDAWAQLSLGLCAYGVAALLTRRARGFVPLALGIVATMLVRPHIALLVVVGIGCALTVRRPFRKSPLVPVARIATLLVFVVAGTLILSQAKSFLGVQTITSDTVSSTLSSVSSTTGEGGSSFTPVQVRTPLDLPYATLTVLFRPFPFEAHNAQMLLASTEGVFLLGLCAVSWRRIRQAFRWRYLRDTPYVAYCLGFLLVFIIAFSAFSNFGILARERSQVVPMLLVLVSLPPAPRRDRPAGDLTFDEIPRPWVKLPPQAAPAPR